MSTLEVGSIVRIRRVSNPRDKVAIGRTGTVIRHVSDGYWVVRVFSLGDYMVHETQCDRVHRYVRDDLVIHMPTLEMALILCVSPDTVLVKVEGSGVPRTWFKQDIKPLKPFQHPKLASACTTTSKSNTVYELTQHGDYTPYAKYPTLQMAHDQARTRGLMNYVVREVVSTDRRFKLEPVEQH